MLLFDLLNRILSLFAALLSLFNLNVQKTTVELYCNPASGYSWEYEIDNDDVLSFSGSHYQPDSGSALSGTGGGTKYFTFKAVAPGTANVTFRYYKYENSEKVITSQYIYTYTVEENGNITLENIQQ